MLKRMALLLTIAVSGCWAAMSAASPEAGTYLIVWQASSQSYMTEKSDGTVAVGDYSTAERCFWELIATGNPDCYYIRNTATGRYLESCNKTPASASVIHTTATPVEYYIGSTTGTDAKIQGCYWMSSTDCTNYSDETQGPRALNKDGASSNVITWNAGHNRPGSYWRFVPTENLYEVRPFESAAAADASDAIRYSIVAPDGKVLTTADGQTVWRNDDPADAAYAWIFTGSGNAEGYTLNNPVTGALEGKYRVNVHPANSDAYQLTELTSGEPLTVDGVDMLTFGRRRTEFSLKHGIYRMACGTVGSNFIRYVTISGPAVITPLEYPISRISPTGTIRPGTSNKPTAVHTLYTACRAMLSPGQVELHITLYSKPTGNQTLTLYADWNRDGVFEYSQPLAATEKEDVYTLTVPNNLTEGSARLRLRLTDNGLTGAEDETNGHVLDLVAELVNAIPDTWPVDITVNDPSRGHAELDEATFMHPTATAVCHGDATFVCWLDGVNPVSGAQSYDFDRDHHVRLKAVFGPSAEDPFGGIDTPQVDDPTALPEFDGRRVICNSTSEVRTITVYTLDGRMAAANHGSRTLDVSHLPSGIYLARAITAAGVGVTRIVIP